MRAQDQHNAAIIDQFSKQAAPFAELPAHSDQAALVQCFTLAGLTAEDVVLDVACGPGILACAMAETAHHVTGIDLTPAMIAQARRRQEEKGIENVSWQIGDGQSLPFADGAFSLVTSRYAFHHLLDPRAMLAEMRRVCAGDGRIMVIDATPAASARAAYDEMERRRDPSHVQALTVEELRGLGRGLGLGERRSGMYRLGVKLEEQLRASAARPDDAERVREMLRRDADDGSDKVGVGACRKDGDIHFSYPIAVVVWGKTT